MEKRPALASRRDRFTSLIETSMEAMPFPTKMEMSDTYPAISVLQRGLQVTTLTPLCAKWR